MAITESRPVTDRKGVRRAGKGTNETEAAPAPAAPAYGAAGEVTALIVDDHQLFADVMRATLEEAGITVLDVALTSEQGLKRVRRERPTLVLVDLGLPDESGLALGRKILEESPETRVVAVTALHDSSAVAEALRLGFQGYVTKETPVRQFLTTISAVLEGQVVVPKTLARRAAGARTQRERQAAFLAGQLTPREKEVLTALSRGANTGDIARELSVSPNTVRTHAQSILIKLQAHSRLEAVAYAIRHGIIRPQASSDGDRPATGGTVSTR